MRNLDSVAQEMSGLCTGPDTAFEKRGGENEKMRKHLATFQK